MYQGHQAPYLQTVTGFLHHSPLPALPPPSNLHQHFQTNNAGGDGNDADASSASASAVLLFESRQTNRELRLQLTDALLKLDRLLVKVDEIGAERSSDVVLRGSSLLANASGFEPGPTRSTYFQLTRENEELKSKLSEMTVKLQSHEDNISRLLENNQKLLEQNVELMGRSFDSSGNQLEHATNLEGDLTMNSFSAAASDELNSLKVELASMRTREAACQRQIEKLIQLDQENKQQIQKTDIQLTGHSQTTERLIAELKEEKRRRREAEMTSRALANDAEETRAKNTALQKALSDLKSRSKFKVTELENDIKSLQDNHQKELSLVKERFRKDKSRVQEEHSELLRQTEESLNSSWKRKYANLEKTLKERHSLELEELSAEKAFLVDRVASLEQKLAELKAQGAAEESSRAALLSEVEEYKTWKTKYDNLRTQAIAMKDRYAQQMNELKEEISLLEEKNDRMTEKYYKAEESLSVATLKYEEFKIRSLDGHRDLEVRVQQLEAEAVSTKSELDEALRRGVRLQLDLDATKDKYLRLAKSAEALEIELEQGKSHVTSTTVAPLARPECTKNEKDIQPHFPLPENANEVLLMSPGDASNILKCEPKTEKQEHEQERKEQEGEEQEKQPEVKEREENEEEEDEDDDDGASFVTALSDDEVLGCLDRAAEDFLTSDGRTCRSDLENYLPIESHLGLGNDATATSSNDLDITRNFLQADEQNFGNGLDPNDLEEINELNQPIDRELSRDANLANESDMPNGLDLNPTIDLQDTEVTDELNETDLTLPDKLTLTSCDLPSRAYYESTSGSVHSSKDPDLRTRDDLEAVTELDLGVDLDFTEDIKEPRSSDDLQQSTLVPPPSIAAVPTAQSLSSKLELPFYEGHEVVGTPFTNQKGGFNHEENTSEAGKLENIDDDEFQNQTTSDSESINSSSSKNESCGKDLLDRGLGKLEKGWIAAKLESADDKELDKESETGNESLESTSSAVSKNENCDEATSDLENLDPQTLPEHFHERKDTVTFQAEDSTYIVTSGGQIVPGWTDSNVLTLGGVSRTIPEVDLQHPVGRTTGLDITGESSSVNWIAGALEAFSSRLEEVPGTSEVPETGSESLRRKPEDPVLRVGACVILREEDIEKMMKRRSGSSEKEDKRTG